MQSVSFQFEIMKMDCIVSSTAHGSFKEGASLKELQQLALDVFWGIFGGNPDTPRHGSIEHVRLWCGEKALVEDSACRASVLAQAVVKVRFETPGHPNSFTGS